MNELYCGNNSGIGTLWELQISSIHVVSQLEYAKFENLQTELPEIGY